MRGSDGTLNDVSTDVDSAIRAAEADLIALSHSIHAEPELAFEEYRSAAKVTSLLSQRGFDVRQRQPHRFGERVGGDRSQPFEAAASDFDQRFFGRGLYLRNFDFRHSRLV